MDGDLALLFDSAWCPDPVPDGYDGCLAYAGGTSASHAWTQAELDRVAHLPRLVTWVPTPGADSPRHAAASFRQWLGDHGVPARHDEPRVHVLWDLETGREPDPAWVSTACDYLRSAGYDNLIYGSPGWVLGQPRRAGYLVANPTGVPHLYQAPGVVGTQYAWNVPVAGGVIDQDVIVRRLLRRLWQPA